MRRVKKSLVEVLAIGHTGWVVARINESTYSVKSRLQPLLILALLAYCIRALSLSVTGDGPTHLSLVGVENRSVA